MSWLSICTAKAALAAVFASGLTYGGVALTTPPPAPTPVSAPTTNPNCPAQPANQLPLQPGVGCDYYTDLKNADVPIVSNAVPSMLNLCGQIKQLGPSKAAANLVFAWQNQATPLTMAQAETYVRINQQDVTCR